jgi:hypothetical protein
MLPYIVRINTVFSRGSLAIVSYFSPWVMTESRLIPSLNINPQFLKTSPIGSGMAPIVEGALMNIHVCDCNGDVEANKVSRFSY